MGKIKITPKIILLLLVILSLVSTIRLNVKQGDATPAQMPQDIDQPQPAAGSGDGTTDAADNNDAQTTDPDQNAGDEQLDTAANATSDDQLASSVITVYSNIETSRRRQAEQIELETDALTDLVRDRYDDLGSVFSFDYVTISVYNDRFEFVPARETGYVSVVTGDLFGDYIDVSGSYGRINGELNIAPDLTATSLLMTYYLNENRDGIVDNTFAMTAIEADGYYRVEAANIYISTIVIDVPMEHSENGERTTLVDYLGYIDVDNGRGVDTPDTIGMDHHVSVALTTMNGNISDNYNRNNPEFQWTLGLDPEEEQMNVNLLISLLDPLNSVDITISSQIGENTFTEFDETVSIIPPKGLSSINQLSLNAATFTSVGGDFTDLVMNIRVPDFDFLPLGVATMANRGIVHYTNSSYNRVFISGLTYIDDQRYISQFIKDYRRNTYNITLFATSDSILRFSAISDILFPTISVGATNLLTTDMLSLNLLSRFGIYERDTILRNAVIQVNFTPFLMYRVDGEIQSPDSEFDNDTAILFDATFVNLDGSVLSYVTFDFERYGVRQSFQTCFGATNGDAGVQALELDQFQLISVNRDFNTDKVSELRNENIIAYRDGGVLLKDGLTASANMSLLEDCNDNTFCTLLKNRQVPGNFSLTGLVQAPITTITADVNDFSLNPVVNYNGTTLSLNITLEEFIRASLNGNFIAPLEPNRKILIGTTWTFTNTTSFYIDLNGAKNDIYQDAYTLPWLDLVQVSVSGNIASNGTIVDFDLSSEGLIGQD